MKNHDLVGFYQSRDAAEHARDDLLAAGFDRDDVKVYANSGSSSGGGFWDSIKEALGISDDDDRALYDEAARRGASAVAVSLDDADAPPAQRAIAIMQKYQPMDLDQHATQWRAQGWAGSQQSTRSTSTAATQATNRAAAASTTTGQTQARAANMQQGQQAIPVVEEELQVGKRRVAAGGVRVLSRVTERPVEEQVQLREERVNVERRPVDRPVADADRAFQERAIEATESREEAVVAKQARVVEEVMVNKEANQRTETVRDTVRRTDVDVQQIPAGQQTTSTSTGNTAYADEFTKQIAADQRYRGRDWDSVEPEFRQNFESRYPGNRWDQFKDAVRRNWDRTRNKV